MGVSLRMSEEFIRGSLMEEMALAMLEQVQLKGKFFLDFVAREGAASYFRSDFMVPGFTTQEVLDNATSVGVNVDDYIRMILDGYSKNDLKEPLLQISGALFLPGGDWRRQFGYHDGVLEGIHAEVEFDLSTIMGSRGRFVEFVATNDRYVGDVVANLQNDTDAALIAGARTAFPTPDDYVAHLTGLASALGDYLTTLRTVVTEATDSSIALGFFVQTKTNYALGASMVAAAPLLEVVARERAEVIYRD
tara:strand:- start:605 stop:1351 length:747 start_codon:yes stop_codon:yes gene_type:complete